MGTIRKLNGKRKKPYQALAKSRKEIRDGKLVNVRDSLGMYATRQEAQKAIYLYEDKDKCLTLAEAFEKVVEREQWKESMEKSMNAAFKTLAPFHDTLMKDIKAQELSMIIECVSDKSKSTQNNIKLCLSRCYEFCIEHDMIDKNYASFMRFRESAEKKDKSAYTIEEIEKVKSDPVQMLLLYTGMRISELWKADIVEIHGHLFYDLRNEQVKTRSSKRLIPIHEDIRNIALSRPHDGMTVPNYRYRYNQLVKKLGMDHTPHDCRRTFSTFAKKCGMDNFYRKAIMGHTQGNITDDVYTDVCLDRLVDEMAKLHF